MALLHHVGPIRDVPNQNDDFTVEHAPHSGGKGLVKR
jgi:hypothetical protein